MKELRMVNGEIVDVTTVTRCEECDEVRVIGAACPACGYYPDERNEEDDGR